MIAAAPVAAVVATCPGAPQTIGCNHVAVPTRSDSIRVTVGADGIARSRGPGDTLHVAVRSSRGDLLLGSDVDRVLLRLRGRWRVLDRRAIPAFAWRRDGRAFAFARDASANAQVPARLVLATIAGRRLRLRALHIGICGLSPAAWSPRGRYLGVVVPGPGGCDARWRAAVVDVGSGRIVERGPAGGNAVAFLGSGFPGVAFTPDGRFAVASSAAGLTILPRPGTRGRIRLVRGCTAADPGGLAPDSRRAAIACGRDEVSQRLGILDLATGRRRALPYATVMGFGTAWSPDGRWLATPAGDGLGLLRDGVLVRVVPAQRVQYRLTALDDQGDVSLTATYFPPD